MRIVRAADYRRMPWKNGGGSTTEVALAPATATLDNFDWRISMAHVAASGPFSRFPGINRTLAVIAGRGIHLTVNGGTVTLDRDSQPHFFPGDVETSVTLIDGPIDDLNVMSSRARYRHCMTRHRIDAAITLTADTDLAVVMPRDGDIALTVAGSTTTIADGDTAILKRADNPDGRIVLDRAEATAADVFLIEFQRL
jgi:environmental stress-induced protein Ves